MTKRSWVFVFVSLLFCQLAIAQTIKKVSVRGNAKVEASAIETILTSQVGEQLDPNAVRKDILALYDLGYFSDIRILKENVSGGVELIVAVKEKPAIAQISYVGMEELSEDDVKEKLETRIFSIVSESAVASDVRTIEKMYLEKGYFLAKVSYKLVPIEGNDSQVELQFIIDEGGKVLIGEVHILGNKYFSDSELIEKFFSKPYTRTSGISAPGSVYNEDFIKRDAEVLGYLYKDQGFAQVQVGKPVVVMDADRKFVRVTMEVEEGIQYSMGKISFSGDILYEVDEMKEWLNLKEGDLFRFTLFRKDIEMLIDRYGDKGFAFADVNPKPRFDKEKKLVDIEFEITKGEKVYFGEFKFVGNTKTRDNVIRRELAVADGELYSGTKLSFSKRNIERLGFFEEVQTIKSRDEKNPNILHYKFKVKEKPTGQLQAALGFSPAADGTTENRVFGQGRYSEENQSGMGFQTSFTGRWNGGNNYSLELGFRNPRVNDSDWSFGVNGTTRNEVRLIGQDGLQIQESRNGISISLGRRIIELIRASIALRYTKITQDSDRYTPASFLQAGEARSIIFALSRNSTNNFLDPSDGSTIRLAQEFSGGPFGGNRDFLQTTLDGQYFLPIDFTDTYRTYFRFHGLFGLLWPIGDDPIPLLDRYTLGGPENLRGYRFREVGPKFSFFQSPGGFPREINGGGNRQALVQIEYFFPIIQEANIKGLFFYDTGRVFEEQETFAYEDFVSDVGFGFRWITPVAPFRFEWAYPIEDGKLGDLEFVFFLGY